MKKKQKGMALFIPKNNVYDDLRPLDEPLQA